MIASAGGPRRSGTRTICVALLRAVNLAGHNMVKMTDLCRVATDAGFSEVRSLLQSGNLVFQSRRGTPASIEGRLEAAAREHLALDTDFMVRTAAEWDAMIAANPFADEAAREPGRLLAVCLKRPPASPALARLEQTAKAGERMRLIGAHLYVAYPAGVGVSKLTNKVIEKALGTPATGRNWNTVLRIQQAMLALGD
jgi:uncharacterized protein (DUF1697 family)